MVTVTTILAVTLAVAVLAYATWKKGSLPDAVSEVAYIIPHTAFSIWIAVVGMLLMPGMMESLNDNVQFVGFLSVVGLLCVASSAYYKTEAKRLHYIGGCLCALCATVAVTFIQPLNLLLWIAYIPFLVWHRAYWVFWAEVIVFTTLVLAII